MKSQLRIWRKNKDNASVSTQTVIDVEPQEVLIALNKAREEKNELEQIEIRLGNETLNKMFVVINAVNIDCLSLAEVKDILYHAQVLEFGLSDMIGRDCGRDKPKKENSSCKYKKFEELVKKNIDEQNDSVLNITYVDSKKN